MRITRISLRDLKCHEALDLQPAPGLTIVRGPNEAGKSTLQEALRLALYRKADSAAADIRALQRWGSSSPPTVELELEADGRSMVLGKRFAGPRAEAQLDIDGEVISDFGMIGETIAELTGIPTEAFFRATACVGHAELDQVAAGDEPAISDRLQQAISGADRGTARAKRKLESAIHRYRTEGQKNPGLLKALRQDIERLSTEAGRGERDLAQLESDRATLAEARQRRLDLDAQLTRQQADLTEAARAEEVATAGEVAQQRYERLRQAAALVDESERLSHEVSTSMGLSQLRSLVTRASGIRYELSELEAELEAADEAIAGEPEDTPPHPARWLGLAAVLVAAAGLAVVVLDDILGTIVVGVLTIVALVVLGQGLRMAVRRRRHGLAAALATDAAKRREAASGEVGERHRRKRHELEAILGDIGVPDVPAAEALLADVERVTDRRAHIEGELRGLGVEDRNLRRLEEARDEAADATAQAGHALAGMGRAAADLAASRQAAQRLVETTTRQRDQARSEEDHAQGRVDANLVDADIVAGQAERLSAATAREAELLRRVRVYEATREAIEAAERATLKTAARYLEAHMGPAVGGMTEGRYDEVRVDEKSLAFTVRVPETGEFVSVEQLSQGTADQLFLAARLGLVRLVTMDRRPPLILDDPFVTFDAERAERAVRLLKAVAADEGFQVILLTCSERFDPLADTLVVLAGPATVPAARTVPD